MRPEQMHLHAKYQVSICNGSKVMANVKVVLNRQTNRFVTRNRLGKNNMPPRSYLGGIKSSLLGQILVMQFVLFSIWFMFSQVSDPGPSWPSCLSFKWLFLRKDKSHKSRLWVCPSDCLSVCLSVRHSFPVTLIILQMNSVQLMLLTWNFMYG